MCRGSGGGDDRLDVARAPQQQQPGGPQQRRSSVARNRQLRTVPARRPVRPSRCRNDATVRGRVDLDDPVEVADVDAELQRAGRDDHAVAGLGERRLGPPALVERQRACETNVVDAARPQRGAELLDPRPAVAEDQPLLARGAARRCTVAALSTVPT